MEIQQISALGLENAQRIAQPQSSQVSFMSAINDGIESINTDLNIASDLTERYARGENIATDELMIALEQAQLSLKLAVEVKNKLTAAYQELFRMQV